MNFQRVFLLLFCCHGKENNQTVTYLLNARLICKASVSKKGCKSFSGRETTKQIAACRQQQVHGNAFGIGD
jgi:hypothetical protein